MSGGRVVVLGDVIDDILVTPEGPLRRDTDTIAEIRHRPGGSAANCAAWLGALGAEVDFVGRVHVDDVARHTGLLESVGVRPLLEADPVRPTGSIVIVIEGEQRTMLNQPGANWAIGPDAVTASLLAGAARLHLTGYSLLGERIGRMPALLDRARETGALVSLDPASAGFIDDLGAEAFLAACEGVELLLPNLDEGRALTGLDTPESIAAELARRFPIVVLTLGAAGSVVAGPGLAPVRVPAALPPGPLVDPVGAGDAFAAGMVHALLDGGDPVTAAGAGAACAARAVAQHGARPSV